MSLLCVTRTLIAAALVAFPGAAVAENWPSWRGPTHNGIAPGTRAPLHWSRSQNVRWVTRLPEPGNARLREPGNSTPIVWGNSIFLTQNIRDRRCLMAVDRRNGRPRWTTGEASKVRERSEPSNPYCASSPVTDGTRIIAWFGSLGVFAYDLNGTRLWHADLGRVEHEFGYGSSPVLHENLVFLNFGPGAREFIVALNKETGAVVWTAKGPLPGNDDTYGTWSTPLIANVHGRDQLLVALRDYFAGLDPATGQEIWRATGLGLQAKSSPVAGENLAVISGDLRGAEIAVRLGGQGDVTETHRIWRESPPRRRIATGVFREGRIYGAQANGILDCVDAETGDILWAERQPGSGANSAVWSSPILVGDRLYIHNQGGDTAILRAGPSFHSLAVNSVQEPGNASPVVVDGELILRTHLSLWCFRESLTDDPAPTNPAPAPTPTRPASR